MDIVSIGRKPRVAASAHPSARVPWLDTAKGLCIVLVVMMHATLGVGEAMGDEGFMHAIVAFARPFRMPDFFLVSGLFLGRVIARDWRSYADRRVVHFLYFYLLWLLIQSAFKYGQVAQAGQSGFAEHLLRALVEPYSTLWFIYLLAVFSVVTKLLRQTHPALLLGMAAVLEIAPIETPWLLLNEFCERWVFFLVGYIFAPQVFRLAEWAIRDRRRSLSMLAMWAAANGVFALTPADGYPSLAALPGIGLALGLAGALAIVALAALLSQTRYAEPFRLCGERSIVIYLAFFLPMAATRMLLVRLDVIGDVGAVSLIVTLAAVIAPLVLERMVRHTPGEFLFRRPAWAHLPEPRRFRLEPAE